MLDLAKKIIRIIYIAVLDKRFEKMIIFVSFKLITPI
jgi:hypothetical protein